MSLAALHRVQRGEEGEDRELFTFLEGEEVEGALQVLDALWLEEETDKARPPDPVLVTVTTWARSRTSPFA